MSQELDDAGQLLDDLNAARNPRQSVESKVNDLLRIVGAHHRELRRVRLAAPPPSPSEENAGEVSDEEPSPRNPSKHPDQRDGKCGMVSHDEAKDIALAYIDKAFNNPERPGRVRIRHTIPADYRDNTDLRLCAYIDQQKAKASADAATIAGLREENERLRNKVCPCKAAQQFLDSATESTASLRPEPGGGK